MYDEETGFYYLRSRYYDPEVGRFLNADSTGLVTANPTTAKYDKNLFAYCDNNPVNRADDGGDFWHIVAGAVIGGLISGITSAVSQGLEYGFDNIDVGTCLISAAVGMASGALTASGVGIVGQVAVGAAISAGGSLASQIREQSIGRRDEISASEILEAGVVGGACGLISGAGASSVASGSGGQKQMVKLGIKTVKRTANELSRHGVKAYFRESGRAASYYLKSTLNNTKSLFSIRVGVSQCVGIGYFLTGAILND